MVEIAADLMFLQIIVMYVYVMNKIGNVNTQYCTKKLTTRTLSGGSTMAALKKNCPKSI